MVAVPATAAPPAAPPRSVRLRRVSWRVLRSALTIYLLVLLVLSFFQERLIFVGSTLTQGTVAAQVTPVSGQRLIDLTTAGGDRTVALFAPAQTALGNPDPDAKTRPTILYFYGNAMCLAQTEWECDQFRRLGCNVLIPEFVGYGLAGGKPSEANCYATADAAFTWLKSCPDVDPRQILPAGWSLGAAVACDLAVRKQDEGVSGLLMFSPFTSLDDQVFHLYPFAPTRWLLRHHFRSEDKIRGFRHPLLLVHGERDELIPTVMSAQLARAAAASAKVTRLVVPDAQHNDLFAVGQEEILAAVREYLRTYKLVTNERE